MNRQQVECKTLKQRQSLIRTLQPKIGMLCNHRLMVAWLPFQLTSLFCPRDSISCIHSSSHHIHFLISGDRKTQHFFFFLHFGRNNLFNKLTGWALAEPSFYLFFFLRSESKSEIQSLIQNTLVLAAEAIVQRSFDSLVVRTICSYQIVIWLLPLAGVTTEKSRLAGHDLSQSLVQLISSCKHSFLGRASPWLSSVNMDSDASKFHL